MKTLGSCLGLLALLLLLAWLGLTQTQPALAQPVMPAATHVYDGQHQTVQSTYTTTERGPPASTYDPITQDAIDRWSRGTSTCAKTGTALIYDYNTTPPARSNGVAGASSPATTREQPRGASWRLSSLPGAVVAAKTATGAESALSGALLRNHLRQLEKYGQGGFRELENGRFRYYGNLTPAAKQGEMAGRRLVREWDPGTGATRTWHETLDRSGNIRIVRPETGGPKTHYSFDEFGNFGGAW